MSGLGPTDFPSLNSLRLNTLGGWKVGGIVNLILAPYLINIRQLEYKAAFTIIKEWLELCASSRKLSFVADSLTGNALQTAKNSGYKPMRLDTLKARNLGICKALDLELK